VKNFRTLLFYQYVRINDPEQFAVSHLQFCKSLGLKGRVLVADEGINGTVSGTKEQTEKYIRHLHADERFCNMAFKTDEDEKNSFAKMHVRYKKEIVRFGVKELDVWNHSGKYLEPNEWLKMKDDEAAVVIDFRNEVEWKVGKFKNAVTLPIKYFR